MRKQAPSPEVRASAAARICRPTLAWRLAGGFLLVVATTLRRGSSYQESWFVSPSLALVSRTLVDANLPRRTAYVSRAAVCRCSLAPDTTYTFSYVIVMRAGERVWAGSGSVAITVGPDGALTAVGRGARAASS